MLSRFANKTFALWVIIAGILGFVFPDVFKPIGSWIAILLGVMMFGMGLTLTTADFREIFRRPNLWTTHPLSSGLPLFLIPELRAVSGNLRQPEVKCFAYK